MRPTKRRSTSGAVRLTVVVVLGIVFGVGYLYLARQDNICDAAVRVYSDETITCCSRTVNVGSLDTADFNSAASYQDACWISFASRFGMTSADRQGIKTKRYNCHAYCFYGTDKWLNDATPYFRSTGSGCWRVTSDGSVHHGQTTPVWGSHSCKSAGPYKGKCGESFLCLHNERVYTVIPTTRYSDMGS
jgi:hypothetical protein